MSEESQSFEAADVSAIRADAILMMKEHKLASICIFLFLLLNFFAQLFFNVNAEGLPAHIILAITGGLLLWTFAYRFPMRFLRFFGAFCAGFFACFAINSPEGGAFALFCYWMILSAFTIRMPSSFAAFFFGVSLVLLTFLIL